MQDVLCLHLVENLISENTQVSVHAWSPALVLFVLLVYFFKWECLLSLGIAAAIVILLDLYRANTRMKCIKEKLADFRNSAADFRSSRATRV